MRTIDQARAELAQRVVSIEKLAGHCATAHLADELETIRRVARANGMFAAASVAHALEMALGRGERGPLIDGWLAILRDAVASTRNDEIACDAYAAACSVRLAG